MKNTLITAAIALMALAPINAPALEKLGRVHDDFENADIIGFKGKCSFEQSKGIHFATVWISPEACIGNNGAVKWVRLKVERKCYDTPLILSKAAGSVLKFKADETIIELKPLNDFGRTFINPFGSEIHESGYFLITLDQLNELAKARTIKARLIGFNGVSIDIPNDFLELSKDWQPNIRAFINAIPSSDPAVKDSLTTPQQ